ncbi:type II secretion system F family protein [Kocuria sp. cx-455]|uniref:type II secretion system F family protein n=1 Tax=Kocuria sp. cx-455 TaxID=2771377 RepID=UPI003D70F956
MVTAATSRAGMSDDAAASPPPSKSPGLPAATLVELTATQLDAGLPLAEAVSILAHSTAGSGYPELRPVAAALRLGLDWDSAWSSADGASGALLDYRDALEFTATSGAASASVLRGQAEQVRRAQFRRAERAAEALSVRLVLPLGLCCLPAFMCWGVLPVLMSLLPKVFGS